MLESSDNKRKILIVDDEAAIRSSLSMLLQTSFEVLTAEDGRQALSVLDESKPDLILLDILMPQLDGLETLRLIREKAGELPVIMLTATNTVKTAVQAMKLGAVDYLNKPFDIEELTSLIVQTLGSEAPNLNHTAEPVLKPLMVPPPADFGSMVGKSGLMKEVFDKISQVSEHDATVLITGESGTGKELIARQIHERSLRRNGPFIAINCAAIPETLIESELFGHEKGAFTHAVERRIGHFELANQGTLFLDEIGELSPAVQVKMLRFLQEQEFYRVGRSKPIRVDVRIITATNKLLEDLILQGKFRQDLYYRINVINVTVPPLRDRFEDIPELVAYFVKKLGATYKERKLSFTPEAMRVLVEYHWPGNVRELENVVESLIALTPNDEVTAEDLPRKVFSRDLQESKPPVFTNNIKFEEAERMFETEMIVKALRKTNYVQTRAAELLGISRRILKYKMDKLGISDKPPDKDANQL